jgi:hypothetical protein
MKTRIYFSLIVLSTIAIAVTLGMFAFNYISEINGVFKYTIVSSAIIMFLFLMVVKVCVDIFEIFKKADKFDKIKTNQS